MAKRISVKNIYGKEINVQGKKLDADKIREVELDNEVNALLQHGYLEKIQTEE